MKKCYDKMKDTPKFDCLEDLIKNRPPTKPPVADWPTKADAAACGCEFSDYDDETGVMGRPLFYCGGDTTILISPFYPGLGVMNPDEDECMFDLMPAGSGGLPEPESPPKDPGNNCFNCHNRKFPEM